MRVKYDEIFVAQIKTTSWQDDESLKNKEVIEFGGCLLNLKSLQTSEAINLLVKPTKNVSDYCSIKTGISNEDVKFGVEFPELISYIEEVYDIKNKPWASYGSFAQHIFKRQCQENDIAFPFVRFLNIKSWVPIIFNLEYEVSLKEIMRKLKLEIPDSQDSMDDALNAAIVLKEAMRGAALPCLIKHR